MNILEIVERSKAEKGLRFVNYLIDYGLFYLLLIALGFSLGILYSLTANETLYELLIWLENINYFTDIIITTLLYCCYMFLIESITKGKSIGKFITGTKTITIDGQIPSKETFLKRNFLRAVPFDHLSFFSENGWHDLYSGTRVVRTKIYENLLTSEHELDNLGKKETI